MNALAAVATLLQLGADVHCASRHPDGVGTPLHCAVAAQNEQLVSLLLQYGASPFVVHGEATPLDVATASNNPAFVRKIESLGLFAGWLRLHREPSTIVALLGGGRRPVMRWVVVVPRFRVTPVGILSKNQLRLFRNTSDASPISVWDIHNACMSQDRRSARITVVAPGTAPGVPQHVRDLTFLDGGDGARTPAILVDACLNRTPPRVPSMQRMPSVHAQPVASVSPPPVATVVVNGQRVYPPPPAAATHAPPVHAFPSPPSTMPPPGQQHVQAAPPLPPRRVSQPGPTSSNQPVLSPEAQEAADLEEAIRRSLQQRSQVTDMRPNQSVAARVSQTAPSAPPMPSGASWGAVDDTSSRPATHGVGQQSTDPPPRTAAATDGESDDDDDHLCVICLAERRTAGLLHGTSMHVCACSACATQLQGGPCPICRATVERIVQSIYS